MTGLDREYSLLAERLADAGRDLGAIEQAMAAQSTRWVTAFARTRASGFVTEPSR